MLAANMTLGAFIKALEACPQDAGVSFDFGGCYPTEFASYRGSYEQLALGFDDKIVRPTVANLLARAKESLGKTFEGYKGGDYTMLEYTPLWVSNYGRSSGTAITAVVFQHRSDVCITTAQIE